MSTSASSRPVSRPRKGAFPSSRAPARTARKKPSISPATRKKPAKAACWLWSPYYNKPTQEGLYQHYKAIDGAIGIPIIIYNIPGRSVVDMSVAIMTRLFELPNIAGVKDATAPPVRVSQQRLAMGERFNQLSGEDATALAFNAHGGHGCISVTSNVAPRLCADFQNACLASDFRAPSNCTTS